MALFVFGAGATRGCSFVDPKTDPCLPPLDNDFFTQLQRVRNDKHHKLIKDVIKDIVDLFGLNFSITLETAFTTLEHTIQMLETTGDNRGYKKKELKEMRNRLLQAIAVVLEDSLMENDAKGHSSIKPKTCDYHQAFVTDLLKPGDDIINFNYDCTLDYALRDHGKGKWNARYGYGFKLGLGRRNLVGDQHWQPENPATKERTVHLYKLHGSMQFHVEKKMTSEIVRLKQRPQTKQFGNLQFTIIPPEWNKAYNKSVFLKTWKDAATAIYRANQIVFIGYSLPQADLHSTALFRTSVQKQKLKSLIIVNPDKEVRKRIRSVMLGGLSRDTKILSYNLFEHFISSDRKIWDL